MLLVGHVALGDGELWVVEFPRIDGLRGVEGSAHLVVVGVWLGLLAEDRLKLLPRGTVEESVRVVFSLHGLNNA